MFSALLITSGAPACSAMDRARRAFSIAASWRPSTIDREASSVKRPGQLGPWP